jgi:aminopeptidase
MYQPSDQILQNYADLLVKFALGSGKGVRRGEVVHVNIEESAKRFIPPLRRAILSSGAHMLLDYRPEDVAAREFYDLASKEQLRFFPDKYYRGLVDQIDHTIGIIAEYDKYELQGVDSAKIMTRGQTFKPYMDWRDEKENAGKFTWTLAAYATQHMAEDVGMTLKQYWEQIIAACYLDLDDPITKWREIFKEQERLKAVLNQMQIDKLHVEGENVDLWVQIGECRRWMGGSGRNIPSFEIFTSPDWRGTNGFIYFNQPLYRYGNKITDIRLEFNNGLVTKATAKENQKLLKDMIAVPGANKIGEFSLTDGRMSRITKLLGETLYDENFGGKEGNTHIALGRSYQDAYTGDPASVSEQEWKRLGFNTSVVHTDIISTEQRKVTAFLPGGAKQVIYDCGQFKI